MIREERMLVSRCALQVKLKRSTWRVEADPAHAWPFARVSLDAHMIASLALSNPGSGIADIGEAMMIGGCGSSIWSRPLWRNGRLA